MSSLSSAKKPFRLRIAALFLLCVIVSNAHAHVFADATTHGPSRALGPSKGTFQVLVLLIRFSDHANRVLPNSTYYDQLCNQQMAPYLKQQSYGQYQIKCHVEDWFTTQYTEAYYAKGVRGYVGQPDNQELFIPKLNALDSAAGGGFGSLEYWGQFDADMNGRLDGLLVFHSGYGAEFPGTDCETGATSANRIVSQGHAGEAISGGWQSADGNFLLGGMAIVTGLRQTCNGNPVNMGISTHEFIHIFNPFGNGTNPTDLYDLSSGSVGGTGGFDIMSYPFGPVDNLPGEYPGSMGPWSKILANWIQPIVITSDGTYTARPSTTAADYYQINLGPEGEYLILEYRIPVDYDINFYDNGGLIIWHIDQLADMAQSGAGQGTAGFPGQDGWPENGNHYRVAIVQRDGLYEIEQGINIGDGGDLFLPGDLLGPSSTFPNTASYQGGNIAQSGITITVDSMDDLGLTFTVTGTGIQGDVERDVEPPSGNSNVATGSASNGSGSNDSGSNSGGSNTSSSQSRSSNSLSSLLLLVCVLIS